MSYFNYLWIIQKKTKNDKKYQKYRCGCLKNNIELSKLVSFNQFTGKLENKFYKFTLVALSKRL